jgi:tetratricopeptide (TPR) repeat protein
MKQLFFFLLCPIMAFSQSLFVEVNTLFESKSYVKAQALMETYVASNPSDIKGLELLGDAYGYQKKWDDAIVYYKKLVDYDNTNANYHYKYGGALGMKALSVSKLKALGIIGDVKTAFLTAAELDPKHIDARWALVELYMQLPGIVGGSKKKSLKYADELEQLSLVDGYLAKGYIYEYDDEPELAESYFKKAIKVGGSLTCFQKLTDLYESNKQPH